MSDNVISIRSRRPLQEEKDAEKKSAEEIADMDKEEHLKAIDSLRALVEKGEVRGLILLGRHVTLGLPYQDVIFPIRQTTASEEGFATTGMCPPEEAFFYTGLLEAMKLEFADMAQMAPCIGSDGSVMQPVYEEVEFDE